MHPYQAKETRWQSGMRLCLMLELHAHLVQELNIGTVHYRVTQEINLQYGHLIPALNAWAARALNTQPHTRLQPSFQGICICMFIDCTTMVQNHTLYIDAWITSNRTKLWLALVTCVIDVLC